MPLVSTYFVHDCSYISHQLHNFYELQCSCVERKPTVSKRLQLLFHQEFALAFRIAGTPRRVNLAEITFPTTKWFNNLLPLTNIHQLC